MQIKNYTPDQILNNKFPLDWYKENVNLIDFAHLVYGYEINYKHTSKIIDNTTSWVSMAHPETNDHIIITLSSQDNKNVSAEHRAPHFYYRNTSPDSFEPIFGNNKFDQGSILDFIQFRDQATLGDAIRKIKSFLVADYDTSKEKPTNLRLSASKPVPKGDDLFSYYNVKPIDHKNIPFYVSNLLKIRDIPQVFLSDVKFKNHVFFREYVNAKNQTFASVCFPIISPTEKEVGFFAMAQNDRLNGSFKEILGFKQDGLWFSGFDKSKPLDRFYIVENPIDAISHYALHPELKSLNVLYGATIGTISQHQCRSIDRIVTTYNPKEIIAASDFDAAGQKFNCFLCGQLKSSNKSFSNFQVLQNTNKHHQASVNVSFSCGDLEQNLVQYRVALSLIETINKQNTDKITEGNPFSIHLNKSNNELINFTLNFYSIKDNWLLATDFLASFKNNSLYNFKIDKPVNKDWNDDLSSVKNLFDYYKSFEKDNPAMVPEIFKGIKSFEDFAGSFYNSEYKQEALTKKSLNSEQEVISHIKQVSSLNTSIDNNLKLTDNKQNNTISNGVNKENEQIDNLQVPDVNKKKDANNGKQNANEM